MTSPDVTFDRPEHSEQGPSFASLGVADFIRQSLSKMGVESPTGIQAMTIGEALTGRDICGKASTGSGKTLAFGIPVIQNTKKAKSQRPSSLVLVPTRELAVQVRDVLTRLGGGNANGGLWVDAFYGGVPIDRQIKSLRRGVDVVVATPGRLIDLLNRRAIHLSDTHTIVLDEADLMADMGFLPSVEEILSYAPMERQTMLFSATLDGDVNRVVKKFMSDPLFFEVPSDAGGVSTMSHHFFVVDQRDKADMVEAITAGAERTLVFVRTRDGAERLCETLEDLGVDVEMLTGGVRQGARERVLKKFAAGRVSVLVATDVAARGLDISGLDLVVHYDLPDDEKAFVHRSGRTARAGKTGVVVSFVQRNQLRTMEKMKRALGIVGDLVSVSLHDPKLRGVASGERPDGQTVEVQGSAPRGSRPGPRGGSRYQGSGSGERRNSWGSGGGRGERQESWGSNNAPRRYSNDRPSQRGGR